MCFQAFVFIFLYTVYYNDNTVYPDCQLYWITLQLYISDSFISLEEYMDYKTRTVHLASTETARQQLTLQFKTINMDKDGLLKYWDFVNHEAKLLIAKRPTVSFRVDGVFMIMIILICTLSINCMV